MTNFLTKKHNIPFPGAYLRPFLATCNLSEIRMVSVSHIVPLTLLPDFQFGFFKRLLVSGKNFANGKIVKVIRSPNKDCKPH